MELKGALYCPFLNYHFIWSYCMEWEVCDVIYSQENDTYLLKLYSGPLIMMAEVVSIAPIFKADMLYPIKDAKYLVNKNESRPVKVICASQYSATYWLSQKKIYSGQSSRKSLQSAT